MPDLKDLIFIILLLVAFSSAPMDRVRANMNAGTVNNPQTSSANQVAIRKWAASESQINRPTPSIQPVIQPGPINSTGKISTPTSDKIQRVLDKNDEPAITPAAKENIVVPVETPVGADNHGTTTLWHRHREGISYNSLPNKTMHVDFMVATKTHFDLVYNKHMALSCMDQAGKTHSKPIWVNNKHLTITWPTRMTADCYLQWMS